MHSQILQKRRFAAIGWGLLSGLFFSVTFILNRKMATDGGYWIWTASLRYFMVVVPLLVWVGFRGGLPSLWHELKRHWNAWLLWSTVGFGVFYSSLTLASLHSPGWLIAGSWELTIIAGMLLSPFMYRDHRAKIPIKPLFSSLIILAGVFIMQWENYVPSEGAGFILPLLLVAIGGTAYPLGNRMLMLHLERKHVKIDAYQRALGMALSSWPYWIILSGYAISQGQLPMASQWVQSVVVAIVSGIFATVLFFKATDLVRKDGVGLAAVEATQVSELLFALAGEIIFLHVALPGIWGWLGASIIMVGMLVYGYVSRASYSN